MNSAVKLAESLLAYCKQHPEERFWQALRNWCGYTAIFVVDYDGEDANTHRDTFQFQDDWKTWPRHGG